MIPYGCQEITAEDIKAVTETLTSDFLTQGPKVPEFEEALGGATGAQYVVAVNSGTSALHIACLALGVGSGDLVWTSPISFVASANCARFCGADVDFVDIDPRTYNMDPEALAKKLQRAEHAGRLPRVVIPVHLCGQSCDMTAIKELSTRYGFSIIEDASHGIGGRYKNKSIGSCSYSDITIFSFHPVKIITTAEGGAATTNSAELADAMRQAASHGITRNPGLFEFEADGSWSYQQIALGYNYRITDVQAALGTSQLKRLEDVVQKRHSIAERYNEMLADMPVRRPYQTPDSYSAYHLYVVLIDTGKSGQRKEVFDYLRSVGIGVNVHYIPIHTQPYYRRLGFCQGDFPEAEKYYANTITLPMFHHLSRENQDFVVRSLEFALKK